MALFRSLLRATATGDSARQASDPAAELLRAVRLTNDYIARTHGRSNMFATLFFGVLEPSTGSLLYVNGGHDAPVVFGSGGVRARLLPTGPAVGMMPEMTFEVGQARLEAGEGLLAFTDGVTDARGASGRYGEERLLALLREPCTSASSLLDSIEASVSIHAAGEEQADDITMLAVRRA
jgi:sigma-B regulation protein RsbU (phosphoserine phosphatase)